MCDVYITLNDMLSPKTLGSSQEFQIIFSGFEQCLASQHERVIKGKPCENKAVVAAMVDGNTSSLPNR